MNKPGKFIVIDGTDGSGKTTQLKILEDKLKTLGLDVETADFPQYGQKSAGAVEEYLSGKYGNADEVGPHRASIFYAIDRYDASFKIREWLKAGKVVLCNRYVAANMAHQGGKIENGIERKIYFNWLDDLEFNIFNIPRPDLVLILHMPAAEAQKLAISEVAQSRKTYNKGQKDIHEKDLNHLLNAEKVYLEIAANFSNFELIECATKNKILNPEEIAVKVQGAVNKLLKI